MKQYSYQGGIAINLKEYQKRESERLALKSLNLELQRLKKEVRIKAQEYAKKLAAHLGVPYREEKVEE